MPKEVKLDETVAVGETGQPVTHRLKCPVCGATRFHRGDYVEVNDAGKDTIAITEYRCINCNRVFSRGELAVIK